METMVVKVVYKHNSLEDDDDDNNTDMVITMITKNTGPKTTSYMKTGGKYETPYYIPYENTMATAAS